MDPKRRPEQQRRCGDEHERPFTVDRQQTAARLKREGGGLHKRSFRGSTRTCRLVRRLLFIILTTPGDAWRHLVTTNV